MKPSAAIRVVIKKRSWRRMARQGGVIMSYVNRVLEPGENVVYRTTYSKSLFVPAILLALCALAAAWAGDESASMPAVFFFVAIVLGVLALYSALRAATRRWSTEIAVTDRRVIFKRGLIQRHTVEMNLQKVESVDVDQSLVGRVFDFGDVSVHGTGETFERLRYIDAPLKLRSTITAG
jgi:uncharacterized membrane protein YdbT with pleckstrin-like domain